MTINTLELAEDRSDIAIAVGLTHNIVDHVRAYIEHTIPTVGRVLIASLSTGPGARCVMGGRHAFDLAEALTAEFKIRRGPAYGSTVHLFMAVPNAFAFFLGQRQTALGRVCLYEFDFDGDRHGSYQPALTLPVQQFKT